MSLPEAILQLPGKSFAALCEETVQMILIVEDEPDLAEVMLSYLSREGYPCQLANDAPAALQALARQTYRLVVLDWMLPQGDGLTIAQSLRRDRPEMLLLMVSARGQDQERIQGLQAGLDDYLVKPFHPRELVARVRALLRRSHSPSSIGQQRFGRLWIEFARGEVHLNGLPLAMSPTERALLMALAHQPERVFTRQQLLDLVWGSEFAGSERTVDSVIRGLRARLRVGGGEPGWIESCWGQGYRFNPPPEGGSG